MPTKSEIFLKKKKRNEKNYLTRYHKGGYMLLRAYPDNPISTLWICSALATEATKRCLLNEEGHVLISKLQDGTLPKIESRLIRDGLNGYPFYSSSSFFSDWWSFNLLI